MDSHQNARTTPHSRAEIVRRMRGGPAAGPPRRPGVRHLRAHGAEMAGSGTRRRRPPAWSIGRVGPTTRPGPRPPRWSPRSPPLRRARWTGARIAPAVALSRATVGRILRRLGLARLRQLAPAEPVHRYERARPGNSCTWTSRSSGGSPGSGIGSPAIGGTAPAASAGSTSTWPSMTAVASAMPRSCAMNGGDRGGLPAPRHALVRAAGRPHRARAERQRRRRTARASSRPPVRPCAWPSAGPARTAPRPMARPNASSRRCSASGPTAARTSARSPARPPCRPGCTTTIGTAPMAAFTDVRPSAEWSRRTIS